MVRHIGGGGGGDQLSWDWVTLRFKSSNQIAEQKKDSWEHGYNVMYGGYCFEQLILKVWFSYQKYTLTLCMQSQVRIMWFQVHIMQSQIQQLDSLLPHHCSFVLLGLVRFSSLVSTPYCDPGRIIGHVFWHHCYPIQYLMCWEAGE